MPFLNPSQLLSLDVELDTGQELGLLQVSLDSYLHNLHLYDPNQQKALQWFNVLKPYRILTLPI
jgi:hypothetical protein